MATAVDETAVPVTDASQVPDTNEKVTTIRNPSNVSSDGKDDAKVEAVQTNGSAAHGDLRRRPNGASHNESKEGQISYAAAVTDGSAAVGTITATATDGKSADKDGTNDYPKLDMQAGYSTHEKEAWQAGGIRFAPIRVPTSRRLQTLAVLFHCTSLIILPALFWFTCANPLAWPFLIPYLIHMVVSNVATDGSLAYRSEFMRSLPLWRLFASYFPAKLHKTHDLPADRKYLFGYHPHGIISHGAFCAFGTNALGFADKFPGITNTLVTLDSNFRLPFYRDWMLSMGLRSVSKESILNIMTRGGPNNDGQGRAVTIVIGGARESLQAEPGTMRLVLKDRKGFVKMALRVGADLVPVIAFGENDLYDQLSSQEHPRVHKFQMFVLKVFKFTLPAMHGRGLLNYDVGMMPYRRAINVVVGKPIPVERAQDDQPQQEDIDSLHGIYVEEVEKLWHAYKDQFARARDTEMLLL